MRYFAQMLAAANAMTLAGWVVLMPHALKVDDQGMDEELQALHRAKIDLSSDILVVGSPGASTLEEIAYAESTGKSVRYCAVGPSFFTHVVQAETRKVVEDGAE